MSFRKDTGGDYIFSDGAWRTVGTDPTSGCDSLSPAVLNAEFTWFQTFWFGPLLFSCFDLTFLLFLPAGS